MMITIALRYFDKFAPDGGTIVAHQNMINQNGFVYYGKMGTPISQNVIDQLMNNKDKRFLLIHSGKQDRYWLYYEEITRKQVDTRFIPAYYRDRAEDFKTWFKVKRIEKVPSDVMKYCVVNSSNKPLGEASKHSMSPYFIIRYKE
jgi:hypothetical protein